MRVPADELTARIEYRRETLDSLGRKRSEPRPEIREILARGFGVFEGFGFEEILGLLAPSAPGLREYREH